MKKLIALILFIFCGGTPVFAAGSGNLAADTVGVVLVASSKYLTKDYYRCMELLAKSGAGAAHALAYGEEIQKQYKTYCDERGETLEEEWTMQTMLNHPLYQEYKQQFDKAIAEGSLKPKDLPQVFPSPNAGKLHFPKLQTLLDFVKTSSCSKILYIVLPESSAYSFEHGRAEGIQAVVQANAYLCDDKGIIKVCTVARSDSEKDSGFGIVDMFSVGRNKEKGAKRGAFKKCLEAIGQAMHGLM